MRHDIRSPTHSVVGSHFAVGVRAWFDLLLVRLVEERLCDDCQDQTPLVVRVCLAGFRAVAVLVDHGLVVCLRFSRFRLCGLLPPRAVQVMNSEHD